MEFLAGQDPEVGAAVQAEYDRQRHSIELIASESFVSPAILSVATTVFASRYAEGHPGERYYGGCQCVDVVENIVRKRVCQLFETDYANIQPHCSANTNYAVYAALCEHGDMVLGMDLANGGHLTHDSPVNFSGKSYSIVAYGVNDQGCIDHDRVRDPARKHRLRMLLVDASAYPRTIDFKTFADTACEVGAYLFVDMVHIAGLVTVGFRPSPVPYTDVVTTATHKTLRGSRGGMIPCKEALTKEVDSAIFPGSQDGPLERIIVVEAVTLGEAMKSEFKVYQEQTLKNAVALAKALVAEGFDLVSGGTDNHLMLVDPRPTHLAGKETERRLDEVNVTANKNAIPNNPEKPFATGGTWVGTPTTTTRGFKGADMEVIASTAWRTATDFEGKQNKLRVQVTQFTGKYPLYE